MSEQLSSPRITASHLDSYQGRLVTLVGKVTQLRGDQATLDADGIVTVTLNRDAHLTNGHAVQVIGKVNPDLSIKVLSSRDLGPNVGTCSPCRGLTPFADGGLWAREADFGLCAAVVEATHRHKEIFVSS
ncbi:Replication factor A protein 3 [Moelleriella libera RCEF 2490]|uniref:Replication factor A protein 3 n=1 Tax=Moelleriella libera RCEF 2490 TaxID=1081109 RepID=A0A167ZMT1_9HYPO|nr:Replication factor A protein 3 [Moelleriella libera RCEF 2490]